MIVVALATAATAAAMLRAADDARGRWGDTRPVVVARRDLGSGEVVDDAAVEVRHLPASLVGGSALEALPLGSVTRYPVAAGEPLTAERLARHGANGVAALVPEGHRAITIPGGQLGLPPVQVDDLVDVIVVAAPGTGQGLDGHGSWPEADDPATTETDRTQDEPAFPLVSEARVVDVTEQAVTVAVPSIDAPRLAYAVATGVVVVALTGN